MPELVSLAKAKVGDTLHLVSNEMVQMHGGIGMTDAHDAGLYLKRARAAEADLRRPGLSPRPLCADSGLLTAADSPPVLAKTSGEFIRAAGP